MDRTKFVPKFCEKLTELLSKLEDRYPEEEDFGLLHTALLWGLRGGKHETIVNEYYIYVYKFKDAISKRDENFMMNDIYGDILKNLKADAKRGRLKVQHFQKMFKSERVTIDDKRVAWDYLNLLNRLMDGIITYKEIKLSEIAPEPFAYLKALEQGEA